MIEDGGPWTVGACLDRACRMNLTSRSCTIASNGEIAESVRSHVGANSIGSHVEPARLALCTPSSAP